MKLQRQHLKQYVKFIYTENAVRVVLFVALLWPPKIYFDRWFFIFLFMVNGRGIFICSAGYQVLMEKKAEVSIQCTKIVLIAALISVFNRFWGGRSPANIYLFKFNNRNTRKRCEMCSKLTIKTPERCH